MAADVVALGVLAGSACGVEVETDGALEPGFVVTVLGWTRGPAALGVVRLNKPSLEAAAKKRAVLADSSEGVAAAEGDAVVTELAMGQFGGVGADKGGVGADKRGVAKLDGTAGGSPPDEIRDTDTGVATVGATVDIGAGDEVR